MIRQTQDTKLGFHRAPLGELQGDYCSPGRGWYHIYTFQPDRCDEEQLQWLPFEENESLVLLRLDIGAFRNREIDAQTLEFIGRIFTRFADAGKDIILRVLYDIDGKGMAHEPAEFYRVCDHMQSIGSVVAEHADAILLAQGLFVGSWGEMHDSRYLDVAQMRELWKVWNVATQGLVPIAVRRPVQARMIAEKGKNERIGLYDDALLADEVHMGTFGMQRAREALWQESWCAEDEFVFIRKQMNMMPVGGEVLPTDCTKAEILAQFRAMQISYLNSIYHPDVLEAWKRLPYEDGKSFYQYIGDHLGYRFVVRGVKYAKGRLSITIENDGFAPLYEAAEVWLVASDGKEAEWKIPLAIDLQQVKPGAKASFSVDNLSKKGIKRGDHLYIEAARARDGRVIRFANESEAERTKLGTFE